MASFGSRPVGKAGGAVTAVITSSCCVLARDGPSLRALCSAVQALQIATSSVARAVWCGSGVVVDGKTECNDAEVADGLVWIASRRLAVEEGLSPW